MSNTDEMRTPRDRGGERTEAPPPPKSTPDRTSAVPPIARRTPRTYAQAMAALGKKVR